MKINYIDVKNPKWENADHTMLSCEVNFEHLPEEYVAFSAVASGDLEHTHKIFAECVAGKWGAITEYIAPPEPTAEQLYNEAANNVRSERDRLLAASDWTQLPDTPQALKDLWAPYRQALRDVPQQTGFPYDVTWPTPPS